MSMSVDLDDSKAASAFLSGLQAKFDLNKKKSEEKKATQFNRLRQDKIRELDMVGQKISKEKMKELNAEIAKEIPKEERNVFNQCIEEESRLISSMGKKFVDKVNYIKRAGQRDVEHEGKGVINKKDPNIHYFLQCKADLDLALPILEKVFKKTLVLQEYTLSKGHCRGLARACRFFDHKFVNRVLFSNCGIDDFEFASILDGLAELKDFKSIIYKQN